MKVQCTNAISVGTTPSESRAQMLAPPRVPVQQTARVTRSDGSLYTPRMTDVTCTTSTPLTTQPSPAISYNSRPPMNKPQRITPPRVSAQQTVRVPRTGQSPYFNPLTTEATYSSYPPYNYYKRPAHHNEPQILNLSVPRPSEVFQNLQTDILDLSTSRKSTPSSSEDEHLMTLEDTHQTRAQSVFSPDSPRTTPSSSPTPSETETPYSPTMPYYNPNSNTPVPEYEPTMRVECSSTGFPPKPIPLEQVRSRDRYSYLLHDPRTMFAGPLLHS